MTPDEYIQSVHNGLQQQGCGMSLIIMCLVVSLGLMGSCRTKKTLENTDIRDSVRTEYIERIVTDTVTVTVEVPAESGERLTPDSTSYLETSFARSTASLTWRDGQPWLFHSLENMPQRIEKPVEVRHKERTRTVYRTRHVSRYKYVEAAQPWWKQCLMYAGAVETLLLTVIVGILAYVGRRRIRME